MNAIHEDRAIAGSALDFLEARHVVLKGTNEEIGYALATIARERYQVSPEPSSDRFRTRVQRRYFERNYPILHDRMRGVAAAFGKHFDDDGWDFSCLSYVVGAPPGCSVVYYPPGVTTDGNGVVSRNYEYGTGTVLHTRPEPGELPVHARPFLLELHPDRGHPSLALCAFDLLSGVLDGINSEGLTVAMLADDESEPKYPLDPAEEGGVGLDECQTLRMLLDTCANAEEAKEALLLTKQYYTGIPNHFLIADRHGKSFVWEYSHAHNREHIIENPGKPLISTNFRLHEHLDGENLPSAEKAKGICLRYSTLAESISAEADNVTVDVIKKNHEAVDATWPAAQFGLEVPIRTLWHALYFPERRKLQVSFYLGDEPDREQQKRIRIRRSEYLEFVLTSATTGKG